jgi:hypothetical protein
MFTFDSIPHMRSKVEASEIKKGNAFSRRTSPVPSLRGGPLVAGRFMLGGIDQLVPMEIPDSQLACKVPPLAWLFVELA